MGGFSYAPKSPHIGTKRRGNDFILLPIKTPRRANLPHCRRFEKIQKICGDVLHVGRSGADVVRGTATPRQGGQRQRQRHTEKTAANALQCGGRGAYKVRPTAEANGHTRTTPRHQRERAGHLPWKAPNHSLTASGELRRPAGLSAHTRHPCQSGG